jgi:hypothetical protein
MMLVDGEWARWGVADGWHFKLGGAWSGMGERGA